MLRSFFSFECFNFQLDDVIGSDQWKTQFLVIEGFDFIYGYVYDIVIEVAPIDNSNCSDDCPENQYKLIQISSKTEVQDPWLTKPQKNQICTLEYAPVCGCNDFTYGNACIAAVSGVKTWTLGECN